jgi:CRISPR-associated protein Cmr4
MYTEANIMFFYTETSLHVGSGTNLGAFDLPVQREKYTNYPNAFGGGVKGALREWFMFHNLFNKIKSIDEERAHEILYKLKMNEQLTGYAKEITDIVDSEKEKIKKVFGPEDNMGSEHAAAMAVTEARVLLFPVRSTVGTFAYVTCPFVLNRFKRDLAAIEKTVDFDIQLPNRLEAITTKKNDILCTKESNLKVGSTGKIILEEYAFTFSGDAARNCNKIAAWISTKVIPLGDEYIFWREKVKESLILINDNDFKTFVERSTEIQTRIKLGVGKTTDPERGGNLFTEENIPCDTLFYSTLMTSIPNTINEDGLNTPAEIMNYLTTLNNKRMQLGGDETIGKGLVKTRFLGGV